VIATHAGGTPEAICNDYTGFLFEPGDARALADKILFCFRNRKKMEEISRNARIFVEKEFSLTNMIKKIEALYLSCLNKVIFSCEADLQKKHLVPGQRIVRTAKTVISFISSYCGINCILKKTIFSNKFVILAYHKVDDLVNDPLNMSVSILNFEKHIRFISKKFHVFSLKELVQMVKLHRKIPYNAIAVTFDDGYEDNYINAYPILKKYNVPATFFLTVECIENKRILWYEFVLKALEGAKNKQIDFRDYGLGKYIIPDTLERAQWEIVSFVKTLTSKERKSFLDTLVERSGLSWGEISSGHMMLSWENIRQMQKYNFAFESHGLRHTIFSNLSIEELEEEIFESRRIISEQTGVTPTVLAFPNGQKADFGPEAIAALKKFGYESACTLESGLNGYDDIFRLKRYCMDNLVGAGINDRFSGAVFDTTISGIFTLLKK